MKLPDRLKFKLDLNSILDRRSLLLIALCIGSVNTLIFYFLPSSGFDRNLNLLGFIFFVFLGIMVRFFNTVHLAAHGLIAAAFAILVPMVSQTGGINSPNMVWMPLLPMVALILIGVRWSLLWLAIILVHNGYQFVAVQEGWGSGEISPLTMSLDSALLTKLNILAFLMFALGIYDLLYRAKMQEVSQRNTELEATQAALLDAQNHKDEFIASVGHELRTPMNAILGLNGVLLDELAGDAQQSEAAHHIRDATHQLLRVVNDILDISQLEAGRMDLHLAPFALAHAILASVNPFQAKAQAKGLALTLTMDISPSVQVQSDRQRLLQVIGHLVDNAVKFSSQGAIEVRANYRMGQLRFEVEDSGPGLAATTFETLFNRFSNTSSDTRRASVGAGLGLAVCHRLVSHAGGRIAAQTGRTTGALFWFEWPMPMHRQTIEDIAPVALAPTDRQAKRFLVVDDHPMNQMVVQLLLRKLWPDCQVAVAQSGMEALTTLENTPCDLVLMDLYMPGMDGIQTTRQLRQHRQIRLRTIPVMGLTANQLANDTQRCLDAGMQSVVFKPIDQALFLDAVERAMGQERPV